MRRLFLFLLLILAWPHSSHAQGVVIGTSCPAAGQNAISTQGVPVVCTGSPLVWTNPNGSSSGSGGQAGALADSTIYLNQSCGGAANCFQVTTGQIFYDCTYTSGQPTVTCSASDTLTTSMIGWRIQLACCGGLAGTFHIGSALQTPAGTTISSVNPAAHTITMSANATATEATTGLGQVIAMGPLNDTNIAAAMTAALGNGGRCAPVSIGAGIYFVSQGFGNTTTCKNGMTNSGTTGWGFSGSGPGGRSGSTIFPVDNFNFSTCTGQNSSCFFGIQGAVLSDFAIYGGDNSTNVNGSTCGTNAKKIVALNTDSLMHDVLIAGWCANDTALIAVEFETPGEYCIYCIVDGAGGASFNAIGNTYLSHSFGGDSNGISSATNPCVASPAAAALMIQPGAVVQSLASGWGGQSANVVSVCNGGTHFSTEDRWINYVNANNPYEYIIANSATYVHQGTESAAAANANSAEYVLTAATSQLHIGDSVISSGASNFAVNCSGGTLGQVYDEGGNSLQGGAISNCGTANIFQSGSVTGTALATSNVGLTSGWATSSVATAGGDSHSGRFTITGAVGSANPTLTLTFPTAYWAAPTSCVLFENTTDLASLTSVAAGTPTKTTVLFTFAGTPAAVTYTFDYRCQ